MIKFSHSTNFEVVKNEYQLDKRVRINQALEHDKANAIHQHLKHTPFENAYIQNGQFHTATDQKLRSLPTEQQRSWLKSVHQGAAKGIGFLYGRHALSVAQNSILTDVRDWLNHPDTLKFIKDISGFTDIVAASAQATRYLPGQFLTRHNDINTTEKRRVAYVLNFTQDWHPDWGGLLQFYQQDGTPKDAWSPRFNSMTIFDVNHVHAVTYVAPFAQQPRLAIAGWFRATPVS